MNDYEPYGGLKVVMQWCYSWVVLHCLPLLLRLHSLPLLWATALGDESRAVPVLQRRCSRLQLRWWCTLPSVGFPCSVSASSSAHFQSSLLALWTTLQQERHVHVCRRMEQLLLRLRVSLSSTTLPPNDWRTAAYFDRDGDVGEIPGHHHKGFWAVRGGSPAEAHAVPLPSTRKSTERWYVSE